MFSNFKKKSTLPKKKFNLWNAYLLIYPQSAEDGRIAEDLPGAHPFWALGAGRTVREKCTRGALTTLVGAQYWLPKNPGCIYRRSISHCLCNYNKTWYTENTFCFTTLQYCQCLFCGDDGVCKNGVVGAFCHYWARISVSYIFYAFSIHYTACQNIFRAFCSHKLNSLHVILFDVIKGLHNYQCLTWVYWQS